MDDNMNNDNLNNEEIDDVQKDENSETTFGSSEYYKKLYDDMPEDVAEMLIGTHPLMKKEVSDELTHNMRIRSARAKNRRAMEEPEETEYAEEQNITEEPVHDVAPSKDPVDEIPEEPATDDFNEDIDDVTSFTKGLVSASAASKHGAAEAAQEESEEPEEKPAENKSENDITAEKIAQMLGGGNVTPVDESEYDDFEFEDENENENAPEERVEEEKPLKKHHSKKEAKKEHLREERPARKKRKRIDEKDLELSNIDKQANLNELFREDDDYYDEKHSGNSVVRIVIIAVVIVVFAFLIYKAASLSGQVSKLNEQIETYKTMEQEYEQLKLDNLSLTEQVEALGGGQTTNSTDGNGENGDTTTASTTNNSQTNTNQSSNSTSAGSTTYTVQSGDTYWGIATKVYGNGSYYTKILSANGLTEKDTIQAGTVLTIPAL